MYMVEAQESIENLCAAIVRQACLDYILMSEKIKRYSDKKDIESMNDELHEFHKLVKWFRSDSFRSISRLNAENLMARLDKSIEKGEADHVIKGTKRL